MKAKRTPRETPEPTSGIDRMTIDHPVEVLSQPDKPPASAPPKKRTARQLLAR